MRESELEYPATRRDAYKILQSNCKHNRGFVSFTSSSGKFCAMCGKQIM